MGCGRRLIDTARAAAFIAGELTAWWTGQRRWFRVRGDSMLPTLEADDCVLVHTQFRAAVEPGDVVVANDPERADRSLVKRVGSVGDQTFAVLSDNPTAGRDSRHFGSLPADHLVGPATLVFARTGKLSVVQPNPMARIKRR